MEEEEEAKGAKEEEEEVEVEGEVVVAGILLVSQRFTGAAVSSLRSLM